MNVVQAFAYLIQAIFGIYSILVLARFMLQLAGADFYNPISQTVVKVTRVPLNAIRKIIPSYGRFDGASLLWLFIVQIIMQILLLSLTLQGGPNPTWIVALIQYSFKSCAALILNFWLFSIFIEVIGSWVAMGQQNPMLDLVAQINRPIMEPIRKVLPSLGGLDLSPIIALIGISFFKQLFGL